MSDLVFGKDVIVYQLINQVYYPLGCATDCTFRYKNEIIYKTSVNSPGIREKAVRISDCSGSVSGLVKTTNVDSVVSIFWYLTQGVNRAVGTFKFEFTDQSATIRTIIMDAVVESIEIRGSADPGFAEFDLNFEGTSPVEMDTVSPPTESGSQIDSETYTISGSNNYIEHANLLNVTIIEVDHEGTQFDVTTGSPVGRQFKYTPSIGGMGRIEFEAAICSAGQKVFVIWLY